MDQIFAHLAGDYLLQSRWMAEEKTKRWAPAIAHGLLYTLPFLLITTSWIALAIICSTHILIDRYRIVRYIMWVREHVAPRKYWPKWQDFKKGYGGKPEYRHFWLMIIFDNTIHIAINYLALQNWG